jgi:hypothetical protein
MWPGLCGKRLRHFIFDIVLEIGKKNRQNREKRMTDAAKEYRAK